MSFVCVVFACKLLEAKTLVRLAKLLQRAFAHVCWPTRQAQRSHAVVVRMPCSRQSFAPLPVLETGNMEAAVGPTCEKQLRGDIEARNDETGH